MKKKGIVIAIATGALATTGLFAACAPKTPPEPESFTVAFESAWGGVFDTQDITEGANATKPADPERVGYTFDGWYLGNVPYTFTEPVTQNITLVAKFTSVLGGDGTAENPYTIDNAAELELLKSYIDGGEQSFISAYYVQTANIVSSLTAPLPTFTGVYDGKGYTVTTTAPFINSLGGAVKNLEIAGDISSSEAKSVGMLANTAENADIARVSVSGGVSGSDVVGGIVGELKSGRIEYCSSAANVFGGTSGGIVGKSSGVVINSVASGNITESAVSGGAVGKLLKGALVQNVGYTGGTVSGTESGGIIGVKQGGSAVYRCFTGGGAVINGPKSGGIVGSIDAEFGAHTDITDCYVQNDVTVDDKSNTYFGQSAANNFNGIGLPSAVWDTTGELPSLKASVGNLPSTVNVNVNGTVKTAPYGSHETRELFTSGDAHFSTLIEIDGDVTLKTAMRINMAYNGFEFTAGNAAVDFSTNGAKLKSGAQSEYSELTYVNTFAHTEKLLYTPDFNDPSSAYTVEYAAPVSIYGDGKNYYAFVVGKQYVGNNMYMAFMRSYVYNESGWTEHREWDPISDYAGGAYKYTVKPLLSSPITYMLIIDGDYAVDGNDGYYLTRFVRRVAKDEGGYTESAEIIDRGQTVLYLGDSELNAPTVAFSYYVDNEGYSNFFYRDGSGKLISSEGVELSDATADFLAGTWFDGESKFEFDIENKTVTVTKGLDVNAVPYTVDNGTVKFTAASKSYEFKLKPGAIGSYTLVGSASGSDLVMAAYISSALDGEWITENGDVITVSSDTAAYVTFNGQTATANEAVYNGIQAIRFTVGDKEYHLTVNNDKIVAVLYSESDAVYAYDKSVIEKDFTGSFVSVVNGVRHELEVSDELEFTLVSGATQNTGSVVPVRKGVGKYELTLTVGSDKYTVARVNDVITVKTDATEIVYTDAEVFARFVKQYTSGTKMLEITAEGKFVVYDRGEEKGEYTNLTAGYRQERYEYGLEYRGFVLYYASGDDTMFFYADTDTTNIQQYRAWVNSEGNDTATRVNNFVPQSELQSVYGAYTRTFNGHPDTLTFGNDGKLLRTYTDAEGVSHDDEEIVWYPILNYNYKTETSVIAGWTLESAGIKFESSIDFTGTGLSWGAVGSYLKANEVTKAFEQFKDGIYIAADNTHFTYENDKIELVYLENKDGVYSEKEITFIFDAMSLDNGAVVVDSHEGFVSGGDGTAVIVFKKNGDELIATVTVNDNAPITLVCKTKLDYHDLFGSYVHNGTTYTFEETEGYFGSEITLTWISNNKTNKYSYKEYNGINVVSDGNQAIKVTYGSNYRYIWRDGKDLMISESLDVSKAIKAVNSFTLNMPTVEQIKAKLDGQSFVAADKSEVSFITYGSLLDFVENEIEYDYESGAIVDDVYVLEFQSAENGDMRYVKVYVDEQYNVVKLLVGETQATATKEYVPSFIPPTVDELKDILQDTVYKTADGATLKFTLESTWMGDYYKVILGDDEYDYKSGEIKDGKYILTFKDTYGSSTVIAEVTYTADGVQKVVCNGKDYLPMSYPEVSEVANSLANKKYKAEDGDAVEFAMYGSSLGIETSTSLCYYDNKGVAANGVYTLTFKPSLFGSNIVVIVTYDLIDGIQKITIDGKDYFEVTELTADDIAAMLAKTAVYTASDNESLYFNKYSDGCYVQIGASDYTEYKYDGNGTLEDNVCTLKFTTTNEDGDEPVTIEKTITVTLNDGVIEKVTLDGKDYMPQS